MPTGTIRQRKDGRARTTFAGRAVLRSAMQGIWQSVTPSPDTAWLADAQIRLMRSGTHASTLMIPAAAFLVQFAFKPWVSPLRRNIWWIGVAILCVAIDQVNRRIDKMTVHDARTVARKARLSVALSLVFYLSWCSMSVFFWTPGQPEAQMLLVLILACSMAGSAVICAAHPASAITALVVHALFLILPTAFGGNALDVTLSALSAIFLVLVTGQFLGLNSGMTRMLKLEHERSGMVRELRTAQRDFDLERGRAHSAAKAKSQFLSNMNHELRTPMNAILGFSELIRSKAFGSAVDKYADYAGIIHDSGQHLLTLIDGMLDLAKIENGKLSLQEVDVDLSSLIRESVAAHEPAARETSLTLTVDMQNRLPRVFADERGLRQILGNLLSNAIKFNQPGGGITVFANVAQDGRLSFGVKDSGVGIARSDQEHVFERFGKGRHDVTTPDKGTGLGLAVVKGFAEAHDGSVTLESDVGSGTRMTVYLPKERVIDQYKVGLTG